MANRGVLLLIISIMIIIIEYYFNINISMVRNWYPVAPLSICGGIIISISLIYICRQFVTKIKLIKNVICFYGKNSLEVLCLHLLEMNFVPYNKIPVLENEIIYFIIIYVIKIILITICILILNKIKEELTKNKEAKIE